MAKKKVGRPAKSTLEISNKKKDIFIEVLSLTGKVTEAAKAAGYADSTYMHKMRRQDKVFEQRWKDAIEAAGDSLEAEAIRRASEGVLEPIYYKGEVAGYKRNYSDQLMMFLLRGSKPEKYNKQGGDTNVNVKFGVAVLPIASKSEGDWERRAVTVHGDQELIELDDKPQENVFSKGTIKVAE
jgi:hypothetical protein